MQRFLLFILSRTQIHKERMSHRKETDTGKFSTLNPSTPLYLFLMAVKLCFKSSGYSGKTLQMWLLCNALCKNTMHLNKTKQCLNVLLVQTLFEEFEIPVI